MSDSAKLLKLNNHISKLENDLERLGDQLKVASMAQDVRAVQELTRKILRVSSQLKKANAMFAALTRE